MYVCIYIYVYMDVCIYIPYRWRHKKQLLKLYIVKHVIDGECQTPDRTVRSCWNHQALTWQSKVWQQQ